MKKVAVWQLHNENGKGMFKCRLPNPTRNSKHIKGVTAKGVAYDYHAFLCSEISGKLIWIDHVKGAFGNLLKVCFEQENQIHILELDAMRSNYFNDVIGALMNTDYLNEYFNLSFAIMTKKDRDGNPMFNDKGVPKTTKKVFLSSAGNLIKNIYNAENPKPEEAKWKQNAKGEWDDSNEIVFWTNHITKIQEDLVENGVAIPFSKDSFIFSFMDHPFYKLTDPKTVEKGTQMYKDKRAGIQFMYESKKSNASSVFDEEEVTEYQPQKSTPDLEEDGSDLIDDDLPF